ncbi:MAG: hypothetical protein HKP58_04610, partial [Desulfatitalea sp.]|nr:LEA type 2 family protein [Desulfatitalea sp.]NNJ99674.1 hypothetical protein [Desulfatitalea sp.]
IQLAGLRLQEIKGFEATFAVDLRVMNPNPLPVPIQGIDCDLSLNHHHLAKGVAKSQNSIPAFGSELVTVTIYASMLDMVGVAHSLINASQGRAPKEMLNYGIKGHLMLMSSTLPGKIPFDAQGKIDLSKMMADRPQK